MISNWLLQRIVELTITYLVHSTLLLGGVGAALMTFTWLRQKQSPAGDPLLHPIVEERLWKLAAVLPLLSGPLSIFAGLSYEISSESFTKQRPSPSIVLENRPGPEVSDAPTRHAVTNVPEELVLAESQLPPTSISAIEEGSSTFIPSPQNPEHWRAGLDATLLSKPPGEAPSEPNPVAAAGDVLRTELNQQSSSEIVTSSFTWPLWLGLALPGAVALSIIRLAIRAVLVHRFLKRCEPADLGWQRRLRRLTKDVDGIRLLSAPIGVAIQPFACGIWQWTIVLPQGIEEQLQPAEIRALLAHEVAHLIRRDPLWLFVGELLCTGFAIQPLNFLARRRWLQAAELLCDDWAVQQYVSATSLATCLTRMAELRIGRRGQTWGLAAAGRSGLLTRRIEWLLRDSRMVESKSKRHPMRTTIMAFVVAILVGAFGPRFVISAAAESAFQSDTPADRIAVANDLSTALDELQRAESLLVHDPDPQVAAMARRLRTRIQLIRQRMENSDAIDSRSSSR